MKYSFPPIVDKDCTVLILGSLPGEKSLMKGQYYAYPQNALWKILFAVFNQEYTDDYDIKCEILLKNHIALWDMIYCGNREGSLDSDIKNEKPNDLIAFLKEYPNIKKVLLNGKKAENVFKRNFKNADISAITMPSTSPANARLNYNEKLNVWKLNLINKKT